MSIQPNSRPAPTPRHQDETIARLKGRFPSAVGAQLGIRLWTSAVQTVDAYESHLRRYGLSAGRFATLLTLFAAAGPLAPSDVARRVGVSRPTISNLGRKLAAAGLIDRTRAGMGLNDRGRRLMEEVARDHFRRLAGAVDALSQEDRAALDAALPIISDFCTHLVQDLTSGQETP